MAVQIINDMPDFEVHRGEPLDLVRVPKPRSEAPALRPRFSGRAGFVAATIALHVVAFAGLLSAQRLQRALVQPEPMMAEILDAPPAADERPPEYVPPPPAIVYSLPIPQEMSFETDAITPPEPVAAAIAPPAHYSAPPLVESIEYVRANPPVYPKESQRRREYGTVVLLVLVDTQGHPAQIQVERSSGYSRLDAAALTAAEKFRFRPYEVNGVAQPAQVRIPIGFDPPRSS